MHDSITNLVTEDGEERVGGRRVRDVPDEHCDRLMVLDSPFGIKLGDNGCCEYVVTYPGREIVGTVWRRLLEWNRAKQRPVWRIPKNNEHKTTSMRGSLPPIFFRCENKDDRLKQQT